MHSLANSEDPDKMPHDVAFIRVYTVCLEKKNTSEKEIQFYFVYSNKPEGIIHKA